MSKTQPGTQTIETQPGTQTIETQPGTQTVETQPRTQTVETPQEAPVLQSSVILQGNNNAGIIPPTAPNAFETKQPQSAGDSTPEDTQAAYAKVIEQQNATIGALLERTQSLTNQINELIRNGAVITDGQQTQPQPSTPSLAENYVPLKDLGAEFGKR